MIPLHDVSAGHMKHIVSEAAVSGHAAVESSSVDSTSPKKKSSERLKKSNHWIVEMKPLHDLSAGHTKHIGKAAVSGHAVDEPSSVDSERLKKSNHWIVKMIPLSAGHAKHVTKAAVSGPAAVEPSSPVDSTSRKKKPAVHAASMEPLQDAVKPSSPVDSASMSPHKKHTVHGASKGPVQEKPTAIDIEPADDASTSRKKSPKVTASKEPLQLIDKSSGSTMMYPHQASYASASRLGEALHQHCSKKQELPPDVQQCLADMIKTDYSNPTWKNRVARRLQSFTRDKNNICSYDICDLQRLEGQRAVLDLGEEEKHRLIVPEKKRCSDAKLANLRAVDQCHAGLGLAAVEFALMGTLGIGSLSKRFVSPIVSFANHLTGIIGLSKNTIDLSTQVARMSKRLTEFVLQDVFGDALSLFGMSIVPALTSLFMMLPVWSTPDCKAGHYATEGWLMVVCSSLSSLIFYWVANMTMATSAFAATLKNTTGSYILDELRKWGIVPLAIIEMVAHSVEKIATSTDATGRLGVVTSLFNSFATYIFAGLPAVVMDLMTGLGKVMGDSTMDRWIPSWIIDAWKGGLTDFTGIMTFEAWIHLLSGMDDAFERLTKITKGTTKEQAEGWLQTAQSFFSVTRDAASPPGSILSEQNRTRWAFSGLLFQFVSLYMLKFKDWATCFMAQRLTFYMKHRRLLSLKKMTAVK